MALAIRILLTTLFTINFIRSTWGLCEGEQWSEGSFEYNYICSNMNREEYVSEMKTILRNKIVRKLEIHNVNLPVVDKALFDYSNYGDVYYDLVIKQCNVTKIERKSFQQFHLVHNIHIIDNNISYFDENMLEFLTNIRFLDLTNNNIQKFKLNCHNRSHFTKLILNNNSISNIVRNNFKNCQDLEIIQISNSKLKAIENVTFTNYYNLENLDLQNNYLENLSFLESKFTSKMKILNVSHNIITTFPCDIFRQNNFLEELNLNSNQLQNISVCAFQNLTSLLRLHLNNNKISYLAPKMFQYLTKLIYFDISDNKISFLNIVNSLASLKTFDISNNYLTKLDIDLVLSQLKSLEYIDLSGNQWSCKNLALITKYLQDRDISYNVKELENSSDKARNECLENNDIAENENKEKNDFSNIENMLTDIRTNVAYLKTIYILLKNNINNNTLENY